MSGVTSNELTQMIAGLEISIERRNVYPVFRVIDADKSGFIEFEEFEAWFSA